MVPMKSLVFRVCCQQPLHPSRSLCPENTATLIPSVPDVMGVSSCSDPDTLLTSTKSESCCSVSPQIKEKQKHTFYLNSYNGRNNLAEGKLDTLI